MNNALGYICGVLICTGLRISLWMQRQPADTPWKTWVKNEKWDAISGALVALIGLGLWVEGLLDGALNAALGQFSIGGSPLHLPVTPVTSATVGAFLDFVGVWIARRIEAKFPTAPPKP